MTLSGVVGVARAEFSGVGVAAAAAPAHPEYSSAKTQAHKDLFRS